MTMAASAVVIQPVSTATTAAGMPTSSSQLKPVFASGELGFSSSTQETAYDWYSKIARQGAQTIAEMRADTAAAVNVLVRSYRAEQDRRPPPTPGAAVPVDVMRAQFGIAAAGARVHFAKSTEAYYLDKFITDNLHNKAVFTGSLRARVTPDATWVPNLPDLVSVALAHQGTVPFGGRSTLDPFGAFDYALSAAFSMFPTDKFQTLNGTGDTKPTGLVDASMGLSLMLPNANRTGTTRVTIAALGRFRAAKNVNDKYEAGFGGSASVEVPVSERVSLLASFTERCTAADNPVGTDNVHCVSMLGFTFAAAAIQNPTQ
jgi:hypothetical protein